MYLDITLEELRELVARPPVVEPSVGVMLLEVGERKIQVIEEIRRLTGGGLKESKDIADSVQRDGYPHLVIKDITVVEARKFINSIPHDAKAYMV